jgi:hypothetical protein
MITNTGKKLIAKYLINQAPAFASYIAVGCGVAPLESSSQLGDYATKDSLVFETQRMPIISRGYIVDNDQAKIVLTAELPSEERYEITEIGIYPAMANNLAPNTDSKMLFKFGAAEEWRINGTGLITLVPIKLEPTISSTQYQGSAIGSIFRANADNAGFDTVYRTENFQRPRFQNEKIFIRSNTSDDIYLSGLNLDLSENSPSDEISVAFAILDNDETSAARPDSVTLTLVFKSGTEETPKYATGTFVATHNQAGRDLATNRYVVVSKKINELTVESGFDFKSISQAQISVSATATSPATTAGFYVALDGVRLENKTSINPLYGLVAYSPIVNVDANDNAVTIVKQPNTSNLIEFRFNVGV